jgi:hypothetical protein
MLSAVWWAVALGLYGRATVTSVLDGRATVTSVLYGRAMVTSAALHGGTVSV